MFKSPYLCFKKNFIVVLSINIIGISNFDFHKDRFTLLYYRVSIQNLSIIHFLLPLYVQIATMDALAERIENEHAKLGFTSVSVDRNYDAFANDAIRALKTKNRVTTFDKPINEYKLPNIHSKVICNRMSNFQASMRIQKLSLTKNNSLFFIYFRR